jgi:hypothetical protein
MNRKKDSHLQLATLEDCDRLFPLIRRVKTKNARQLLGDYLIRIKNLLRQSPTPPSAGDQLRHFFQIIKISQKPFSP